MSLQVWLPLTKDLRNQGLSNVTVTNNGATFNSAGKLGGCYSFGNGSASSNGLFLNSNLVDLMQEEYSVAVWVKPLGNHYHYNGTIFSSGNWNNTCYAFGLSQDNSQVDILCRGYNTYITCAVPTNTWTHLVCTCDSNNIVYLYKNGELIGSSTRSNKPASDNATQACIGRETYASGYFTFNGMLNDFRLYDHCLSPMEVKELAKGLVLHYPLNRQGWGQENLLKGTDTLAITGNINTGVGGWDNISTLTETTDGIKLTGRSGSPCFGIPLAIPGSINNNEPYTLSFKYRTNKAVGCNFYYIESSGSNISIYSNITTKVSTTEWQDYTWTITNSTVADRIPRAILFFYSFSSSTSDWIEIKKGSVKLEKGSIATPWCPNIDDTIGDFVIDSIYDISGFNNNGTWIEEHVTYSSDASKYTISSNNEQSIDKLAFLRGNCLLTEPNEITISMWVKISTLGAQTSGLFSTSMQASPGDYLETVANQYDGVIRMCNTSGTNLSFNIASQLIADNEWHHYVFIYDGAGHFYKDGVLKMSSSALDPPLMTMKYIYPFLSTAGGLTRLTQGSICDLRIYATALSADDIKSLYQNEAQLDSSGNVLGPIR